VQNAIFQPANIIIWLRNCEERQERKGECKAVVISSVV